MKVKVAVINNYNDLQLGKRITAGTGLVLEKDRADYLKGMGLVKIIGEYIEEKPKKAVEPTYGELRKMAVSKGYKGSMKKDAILRFLSEDDS